MSLESILKYGFSYTPKGEHSADSPPGIAQRTQQELLKLVNAYGQESQVIADNVDLTFEGKTKAKRAAADTLFEALKAITGNAGAVRLAALIERAESAFDRAIPGDKNSPSEAIREWEVRERLDKMNKSEVFAILRKAAADGDFLTINAIRNAPSFVTYLPEGTLDSVIGELVAARNPGQAEALRVAKEARQIVDKSIADVTLAITKDAGIDPDTATATHIRSIDPNTPGSDAAA